MEKLTKKELKKIKESLPHGALKKIAERANVKPISVYKALNGDFWSYKIIVAALEVKEEHESSIFNLRKRLKLRAKE